MIFFAAFSRIIYKISDNEKIFTFNVCLPSGNAVSRSDPADL